MDEWMVTSELAEACGVDVYDARRALEDAGLAEGAAPSALAVRHGLADVATEEAGRAATVWHRDLVIIVRGLLGGAEGRAGADRAGEPGEQAFQEDLLAGLDQSPEETAEFDELGPVPGGGKVRASSAGEESAPHSSIGDIRPGFDAIVATDGACSGNPGPGGWAWVEQISGARDSGGAARTTNNIMELTAVIEAFEYVGPRGDVLLRADSQYVINVMTKWAPAWRRKGWRKADGKPVANRQLVERLLGLYEARTGRTEVEWVRGHSGDAANSLADELAVARAAEYRR
ncbi:MAG: ribonuclease H [Actinomycetaceae bacterium]|nr:ribonuclease H [Actinomycetaceae bacterium]